MKPRVYVETTIFSFYHDERSHPEIVARRTWTREWWDDHRHRFELVTSVAVLEELSRGSLPHREAARAMAAQLPALVPDAAALATVRVYIEHKVMPANPDGDAMHLALASHARCNFLLTWNCAHLANANKFDHIHMINDQLHLRAPHLVTPLELIGKSN